MDARIPWLILCLGFSARAAAQVEDSYTPRALPGLRTRMRKVKFTSLRLAALQLDLAVEDGSNVIALDNWGDNYAGLAHEVKTKLQVLYGRDEITDDTDSPAKRSFPGLYYSQTLGNCLGAFEVEGLSDNLSRDYLTLDKPSAAAAFGAASGNLLAGIGGGLAREEDSYRVDVNFYDLHDYDNRELVAGLGYVIPFQESSLTLGADGGVHYFQRYYEANYGSDRTDTEDLKGPKYGFQAILKTAQGVLGARYLHQAIQGRYSSTYYSYNSSYGISSDTIHFDEEIGHEELEARWFRKFEDIPFNFGMDWMRTIDTTRDSAQDRSDSWGAGLTWRIDTAALLGVEYRNSNNYDYIKTTSISTGIEFPVFERMRLRFSYRDIKSKYRWGWTELYRTGAAGVGYKLGESSRLDGVLSRTINDPSYGYKGIENFLNLQLNFYF